VEALKRIEGMGSQRFALARDTAKIKRREETIRRKLGAVK
jgi:hypothetical protein